VKAAAEQVNIPIRGRDDEGLHGRLRRAEVRPGFVLSLGGNLVHYLRKKQHSTSQSKKQRIPHDCLPRSKKAVDPCEILCWGPTDCQGKTALSRCSVSRPLETCEKRYCLHAAIDYPQLLLAA
jgi:hypothetical protein